MWFMETASPRPSGGAGRGDDGPVGSRLGADGLLDEAGEAVADAPGGAAGETGHVLLGGGREGGWGGSAGGGGPQPTPCGGADEGGNREPQGRAAPPGARG